MNGKHLIRFQSETFVFKFVGRGVDKALVCNALIVSLYPGKIFMYIDYIIKSVSGQDERAVISYPSGQNGTILPARDTLNSSWSIELEKKRTWLISSHLPHASSYIFFSFFFILCKETQVLYYSQNLML